MLNVIPSGTTAHVGISLYGVNKSGSRHLQRVGAFQRGSLDQFHLETDVSLGEVWKIRIWHDNTGLDPSWYVQHVVVWDPVTDHMFFFLVDDWLSVENPKNASKRITSKLSQFRRILSSQLIFGMVEHHLWLSLWERPIHSVFTRAQRVTCSALMLHLYLASGALWYGAVGTQGHNGPVSAKLLFSMETVAVGMVVAVLLFPLQCLICFLFRKCHSQVREHCPARLHNASCVSAHANCPSPAIVTGGTGNIHTQLIIERENQCKAQTIELQWNII
uniref:PLAT domain-containing protein n=1 Tax=Hippocampus comes TaxID=109280 RepID=A0A3Q2Y366_HIPCM